MGFPSWPGVLIPGLIDRFRPPNTTPGMARVELDVTGRLIGLDVRPWTRGLHTAPSSDVALFSAAALDSTRFVSTAPNLIPPMAFDDLRAWTGTYADDRPERVRVEAAFWRGRPVLFEQSLESSPPQNMTPLPPARGFLVALACLFAVVITAWRNSGSVEAIDAGLPCLPVSHFPG